MDLVEEPIISFKKVSIYVIKVNQELEDYGLIPGMVFQALEEFVDGISAKRYWIGTNLYLEPPYCRKIDLK